LNLNLNPPPFAAVHGIGVDIVETARIASSIERFGERFLRRVFTEAECSYCASMPQPERHFGARFAAKEAVSKAFGTGIGASVGWRDIEILRRESGAPYIALHGPAADLATKLGITEALISLSHSDHYAVANAILITQARPLPESHPPAKAEPPAQPDKRSSI
jgi:holo-[acyl-carrier protein] synthase